MRFVCYLFDRGYPPPVLEPLSAQSLDAAVAQARDLLRARPEAHSVEVWTPEGRAAALHRDPSDPTEADDPMDAP